jgi:hypothetical protein
MLTHGCFVRYWRSCIARTSRKAAAQQVNGPAWQAAGDPDTPDIVEGAAHDSPAGRSFNISL